MGFDESLRLGQAAESEIALWLRKRGNTILPIYEKIIDTGKGPQVFTPSGSLVAPDLLVFGKKGVRWIEAKRKSAWTWHRITEQWTTGIDRRHFNDYLEVADQSPWPVWLLFMQCGGHAKDSPVDSPAGLYGNDIDFLRKNINHTSDNWGRSGMVYWAIDSLRLIASLGELCPRSSDEAA